jgi:hypothetical protein
LKTQILCDPCDLCVVYLYRGGGAPQSLLQVSSGT